MSTGRIMQIFRKGKHLMVQITPVYSDIGPFPDEKGQKAICHFASLKYTVGDTITFFKEVMDNFHKEVGAIYNLLDSVEIRCEMQPEAIRINKIFLFDLEADFLYVYNNTKKEIAFEDDGLRAVVKSDEIAIMRRTRIKNKNHYVFDSTIFVENYGVYRESLLDTATYYLIGAAIFPNCKTSGGELILCTGKMRSDHFQFLSNIAIGCSGILRDAGIGRIVLPYNISSNFYLPDDFDIPIVFCD